MKKIAEKTHFSLLIYSELVAGILCYVLIAAVTGLLVWASLSGTGEAIEDPVTSAVILAVFYIFIAVGGGWLIARFIKWKKLPDDLISVDDEYMYIFTNREVRLSLKEIESVYAGPESLFIQIFGGGYGIVWVEAGGKKYKVCFVDEANQVPDTVMNYINSL